MMWKEIYIRGREKVLGTIPVNSHDDAYNFAIWSTVVFVISFWIQGLIWLVIAKLNLLQKWKIQQKETPQSGWDLAIPLAIAHCITFPLLTWYVIKVQLLLITYLFLT